MSDESRERLLSLVTRELYGPYEEAELISENPQRRYIVGQLAASADGGLLGLDDEVEYDAGSLSMSEESDVLSVDSEPDAPSDISGPDGDEPAEDSASIAKARRESLSSIGISFVVDIGSTIEYEVTWGEYSRVEEARFLRVPRSASGAIRLDGRCRLSANLHDRVTVKWIARELKGKLIASMFVLNSSDAGNRDGTERLYQVALKVKCIEGSGAGFLSRTDIARDDASTDADVNSLLFRKRKEYGIGLHTAATPILTADGERCFEIRSAALPISDSRVMTAREFSDGKRALDMTWLATTEAGQACDELRALFSGYAEWPEVLQVDTVSLPPRFRDLAAVQINEIAARVSRLRDGMTLLASDPVAFASFRFANEVMARSQFRTSQNAKQACVLGAPIDNGIRSGTWFPFQLAFIVSTLCDFVHPERPLRDVVDVLFFPTGGGKTEAYLGLALFAMCYRRLRPNATAHGAGISTLMRYTLRLLTTQQFSRAATAMCAAEIIRREGLFGDALGPEPFSIGLWVGPMTPQTYSAAVASVKQARDEHFTCVRNCQLSQDVAAKSLQKLGRRKELANVLPITQCPWCFCRLCVSCVDLDEDAERLIIRCPNGACEYSRNGPTSGEAPTIDGLPLFIVDSDIYRICPSIVIATVDKFATLPFRGEAKSLFGNVKTHCSVCGYLTDLISHKKKHISRESPALDPVDLIIQDELHTITDNLGSIYGLYETAIEFLMRRATLAPKYVCATATIKAVEKQIRSLYGQRRTAIFPPTGLEAGDTYFSHEQRPTSERPGRRYIGIYAPTFSRLSTFVAVLGAILAAAWRLKDEAGVSEADPYLTLLGYFNTIRDLGGIKGLLGDDVPPVLREIAERNGWTARILTRWQDELTGRISSAEVPEMLQALQTEFNESGGCDFMAATNMISVGVDVSRLGAMLVDGQPKTTAEYIQATSRVGRKFPGVVFVVYNAMRPRDVSHYEHFYAYHDSFYKFVEAGSITPFSDGAIDRYVKGAFVAAYRLSSAKSDNESAGNYVSDTGGLNNAIVASFVERAAPFGEHELRSTKVAIDEIQARWLAAGSPLKYVVYRNPFAKLQAPPRVPGPKQRTVLRASDEEPNPAVDALFESPRSMRNVEAEVPLKVWVDGQN